MKLKRKINGNLWTFHIVTAKEMRKQRNDGEFAGLCVPAERAIYIDEDSVDYETVLHELYHAHFSYLYLDDTTSLQLNDLEEITAVFFCNKAATILKQAKKILDDLKELQKENE